MTNCGGSARVQYWWVPPWWDHFERRLSFYFVSPLWSIVFVIFLTFLTKFFLQNGEKLYKHVATHGKVSSRPWLTRPPLCLSLNNCHPCCHHHQQFSSKNHVERVKTVDGGRWKWVVSNAQLYDLCYSYLDFCVDHHHHHHHHHIFPIPDTKK